MNKTFTFVVVAAALVLSCAGTSLEVQPDPVVVEEAVEFQPVGPADFLGEDLSGYDSLGGCITGWFVSWSADNFQTFACEIFLVQGMDVQTSLFLDLMDNVVFRIMTQEVYATEGAAFSRASQAAELFASMCIYLGYDGQTDIFACPGGTYFGVIYGNRLFPDGSIQYEFYVVGWDNSEAIEQMIILQNGQNTL